MPGTPIAPVSSIPTEVAEVFDAYDEQIRVNLLELRQLILTTAADLERVGALTETLKWGQPAYLTNDTNSGSTIRLGPTAAGSGHDYAMFFICHTDLVDRFSDRFGEVLTYEGKRAVVFTAGDQHPTAELRECIAMALTYHLKGSRP